MGRLVAAFGSSHSTMLFSSLDNWLVAVRPRRLQGADQRSRRHAAILCEDILANTPRERRRQNFPRRHRRAPRRDRPGHGSFARPTSKRRGSTSLIVVGDDQREIFKDACRPAIGVYYGDSIRNAAAPREPTSDWYLRDQRRRLEDGADRLLPVPSRLWAPISSRDLVARDFDITAVKALVGDQFEGHAYSFHPSPLHDGARRPDRAGLSQHLLPAEPAEPAALLRSRFGHRRSRG